MWMVTICIAPEVGVVMAFEQWRQARETLRKVYGDEYPEKFSMAHAFFANMGGIVIREVSLREVETQSHSLGGGMHAGPKGIVSGLGKGPQTLMPTGGSSGYA